MWSFVTICLIIIFIYWFVTLIYGIINPHWVWEKRAVHLGEFGFGTPWRFIISKCVVLTVVGVFIIWSAASAGWIR